MSKVIRVAFACNDPHSGHSLNRFEAVDFSTELGTEVSLWGPRTGLRWIGHQVLRVANTSYRVTGYRAHEGNWCWDACNMSVPQARSLLGRLLLIRFQPDEWTTSGPLADVIARRVRAHAG